MSEKLPFTRLSKDVFPINYSLRLQPNLKEFTFVGSEDIAVEVKEATNKISINAVDIKIQEATFQAEGSSDKSQGSIEYETKDEKATFTFPADLSIGKGTLSLSFTGDLNNKMKGFYRSQYKSPEGEDRFGAVTQFEATDARRAFPCWDEPAIKATFDVTLVVPKDRVALSNMPVKAEAALDSDASWKVLSYEQTPIMSTYLLAFVVGEYDFLEEKDSDGVTVRVFTPVGKKEQGKFALEVAVKTLPYYKEYFNIAYPLPKLDLIAIADFSAGAMENWGLVTYRETCLLLDPDVSSARTKQYVALVVGHELAHQWFGNLVTMEWWTHLWLNEGFASWIEYLCIDFLCPEFDIWTQFVFQDLGAALKLDALDNSHPIEVAVGHPSEIDEIFDAISYCKGASVIRMLHAFIGDDDFRKGMNTYLTKFQYGNTFTEDLWRHLEAASGKPITDVMSTWTRQMGYPVLKVSQTTDGEKRTLTISQEKFCADGNLKGESPLWKVPLNVSTSGSGGKVVASTLMEDRSTTITLDNVEAGEWIKVNPGTIGVYRVQYMSDMLDCLIPAIKDKTLPPRDRLGLQNDMFALSRAGTISSVDLLKVLEAFVDEDDYTVWSDISSNLSTISILMQNTEFYDEYKAFVKKLFGTIAASVGWDAKPEESPLITMLRELVLAKLGRYGDEATVTEARKRFEAHCNGSSVLPADLRSTVYVTVLSHGNEETYEQMLKLYDQADMQEEKVRISRSLGAVKQEDLLKRTFEFAMSDKVRAQDSVFVIAGTTSSVKGRDLAWQFLQDNWTKLHERYEGGFLISRLVKSTTENFVTEAKAQEVEAFFKANPAPSAARNIQQSCENIRLNEKWLSRDSAGVGEFLKTRT